MKNHLYYLQTLIWVSYGMVYLFQNNFKYDQTDSLINALPDFFMWNKWGYKLIML